MESTIGFSKKSNWLNNLTYVDGEGENAGIKTKNLYRRPNFIWNSTFKAELANGFTVAPSFRFIGDRLKGMYDEGPNKMPAYYTIDVYVGYVITKKCRAFVDLKNITNQEYFDIVGYNSKRFNMMTGVSISF